MLKYKFLLVALMFTGFIIEVYAKNKPQELHFIVSLDGSTNYWAGPIARWETSSGNQSMLMSFATDVSNGVFHAPGTLVIDIAGELPNVITELGKPFGNRSNAIRLFYQNKILIAHDRKNKELIRCKMALESDWSSCPFKQLQQKKQFQAHSPNGILRYLPLSDHELPMLISETRFVKLQPKQDKIADCKLVQGKADCVTVELNGEDNRIRIIYTYFVRNRKLYYFTNSGEIGVYKLDTKENRFLIRNNYPRNKRISNQFYTSISRMKDVFLGHYPTGDLFRFDPELGSFQRWSVKAPSNSTTSPPAPELQSLGFANGFYWAGLWPFGELYSGKSGKDGRIVWHEFKRLFDEPELIDNQHPFENQLNAGNFATKNTWGQRIDAISNCFSGICITTSNKSGNLSNGKFDSIISDKIEAQYGRVIYLEAKKVVCQFSPENGQIHLTLRITENSIILSDSKGKRCTTKNASLAQNVLNILNEDSLILGSRMFSNNGHYIQQIQRAAPH